MGDGIMAVFRDPVVAVRAVLDAKEALKSVEVAGYTPRMRVGIHTGRPQRLAADWLGVDVNVAARVMERATKGGIMVSSSTLDLISQSELDGVGRSSPNAHVNRCLPTKAQASRRTWRYIASRLLGS